MNHIDFHRDFLCFSAIVCRSQHPHKSNLQHLATISSNWGRLFTEHIDTFHEVTQRFVGHAWTVAAILLLVVTEARFSHYCSRPVAAGWIHFSVDIYFTSSDDKNELDGHDKEWYRSTETKTSH